MAYSAPLLELATKDFKRKHFPRGQIVIYQGDESQDTYILKDGIVKLYDIDVKGNEKILHLLKPPAILPLAFFSGINHPHATRWFYTTLTDCDICVVPTQQLLDFMLADSKLLFEAVNWFSLEVHELLTRVNSLGKTNARDKVAAALKFLAVQHAVERRTGWRRIGFSVNHQLIADLTGLTRESAAMVMHDFQVNKCIRNPRQTILEINLEALINYTDE